jgi:hypothetical protein
MSVPLRSRPYDPYAYAYGPYGLRQVTVILRDWFLLLVA